MDPMTMTPGMATVAPKAPAAGLSIWSMIWGADFVVQFVLLLLLAASVWSWTIIFNKYMRLRSLSASAEGFEEQFWSGASLDDLYERLHTRPQDPMTALFCAAMREWRRAVSKGTFRKESRGTLQQRIDRVMQVTQSREMDLLERHLGFLATVGSSATFIGLFGTVWGIMHAFQDIAHQQNTNLAVVAPGIAEALFATAIGLIAAIPAMVAYNKLASEFMRYGNRLETFANEFSAIISRQLEEAA